MDTTEDQTPPSMPPGPEQGVRPTPRPETGVKPDLINPERADKDEPKKPIPDMDPDGQDPDENETIN